MKRLLPLLFITALAATAPLHAATIIVQQDGGGDFTTIGEALSAAAGGDVILVDGGTYNESLSVTKSISIKAMEGRALVILDGGNSDRIMLVEGQIYVSLQSLTFTNGFAPDAAALMIWNQADVTVEDCRFISNHATGSNAVHVRHPGTSASFQRCSWVNNTAGLHSAALSLGPSGHLAVEDCQFIDNSSNGVAGAVNCNSGSAIFRRNLFLRNDGAEAGALTVQGSALAEIEKNTFIGNSGGYYAVRINSLSSFHRNIVAATPGGYGLSTGTQENHFCNIYFENDLGPVAGSPLGENEFDLDPLFCDSGQEDFSLCADSPALLASNGCGNMGAFGVGCDECGAVATTGMEWGRLKSIYR